MKNPKVHETQTRVRYQETDQMGVVYHSNYLIYFELGRTEFLRSGGVDYRSFEESGYLLAVTEAHVRFLASARYDDLLNIRTWIEDSGHVTILFRYQVLEEKSKKVLAEGSTKLACLNSEKKPCKLPSRILEWTRQCR